jgi:hypothetical protein
MEREPLSLEQIQGTIRAARDSVWVINDTLAQLTSGQTANLERKGNLERNVSHLKLVVSNPDIAESGENIQDLYDAISVGEAKLAEDIWPQSE